jgi:hypothetical protein
MMGTIILTLGLLIIGAVLPIAWRGSIDTAALTRHDGAADAAKFHVENKCLVDGPRDLFSIQGPYPYDPAVAPDATMDRNDGVSYSFLGDLDTADVLLDANGQPISIVHALHVENWAADAAASDFAANTWSVALTSAVPEAPSLIDRLTWALLGGGDPPPYAGAPSYIELPAAIDPNQMVGYPVVRLQDRLFPPIAATVSVPPLGEENNAVFSQWSELLRSRRFAWAVFHRLIRPGGFDEPRYFIMYYVTLRRGESTNRYAREDHTVFPLDGSVGPRAMASREDVLFPIAWRVPMVIESSPLGVPALAYVGDAVNFASNPHVIKPDGGCNLAQMFPAGTPFIDDLSGVVYRVSEREYVDGNATVARLTLDKDVHQADLVQVAGDDPTHRMVWVFPPPVVWDGPRSQHGDPVAFGGFNPVVDIRTEPLILLP